MDIAFKSDHRTADTAGAIWIRTSVTVGPGRQVTLSDGAGSCAKLRSLRSRILLERSPEEEAVLAGKRASVAQLRPTITTV